MIASRATLEVEPFGRRHLLLHPGSDFFPTRPHQPFSNPGDKLADAFKGTTISDTNKEWWHMKSKDNEKLVVEELYVNGNVLVWSQGDGAGTSQLCKSFTFAGGIKQALWCPSFSTSHKPDITRDIKMDTDEKEEILEGICILDGCNIYIMTPSGPTFTTALPFQVERAWSCQLGLLLQRKAGALQTEDLQFSSYLCDPFPVLFNLLHPLDNVTPVMVKQQNLGFFTDVDEKVIFSSHDPSLLVTYNSRDKVHNVWSLRRTTHEEQDYSMSQVERSTTLYQHTPGGPSWMFSPVTTDRPGCDIFSPKMGSPAHFLSRIQSPVCMSSSYSSPLKHMAALSRWQYPVHGSGGPGVVRDRFSPAAGQMSSPLHSRSIPNLEGSTCLYYPDVITPMPDVCLQHLWVEKREGSNQAQKVFFQKDILGQQYLCLFMQDQKQIWLIKFDESNDHQHYILGSVSVVPARDAEPVPSLSMIFTMDGHYTFALYSGPIKLCKVHVPGIQGLGDFPLSPATMPSLWDSSSLDLLGTPKRSSLLPSSLAASLRPKFEEDFLSPVVGSGDKPSAVLSSFTDESPSVLTGNIVSLRDGIQNHVTLETVSGENLRIDVPPLSSSEIVEKLLSSMKSVLPREASVQFLSKWYATRNAPGSCEPSTVAELSALLNCLLSLMGLEEPSGDEAAGKVTAATEKEWPNSPVATKKFKNSDQGSDEDWHFLLQSEFNKFSRKESSLLGLEKIDTTTISDTKMEMESDFSVNVHAPLHSFLPTIINTLHLVYEDCKLSLLQHNVLPVLAKSLALMTSYLGLSEYQDHYWRDFPDLVSAQGSHVPDEPLTGAWHPPNVVPSCPPSIFQWLQNHLDGKTQDPFPHLPYITNNIKSIILLLGFLRDGKKEPLLWHKYLLRILTPGQRVQDEFDVLLLNLQSYTKFSHEEKTVLFFSDLGLTLEDLEKLPLGVSLPLQDVLFTCRQSPPPDWPSPAHILTRRRDLCALFDPSEKPWSKSPALVGTNNPSSTSLCKKTTNREEDDGMDHLDSEVLRLRFSQDQRIREVCRLLQSSKPAKITLQQRPEVSDHEFIEEQERHLYSLCIRTMALPPGRGMMSLRTCGPVVTEVLPVPRLCLMGVAPPRNTTVDLSHIDVPANMSTWPLFHNGVAAGLRVLARNSQIDSNWIVYNKPRSSAATNADALAEHSGFLMGLGLNGHLAKLSTMSLHEYLSKGHELTSVGIVLGLAASKLGSMDVSVTKMMSIHLEALLPPTSTELDMPPMVQTASILGVGLLYCGSVHRHMAEVLMGEIGRPPGPEMEHCVDRESYALAAGLGLGLITFGRGAEVASLADLPMADQLYHYMVGGHKRPLVGIHKEKQKSPSYQIREGDSVNVDVTSPGATLALGMMFFDTGNRAIANWMEAPDTQYLLDMVRPDFLLLRTISHSLILWQDILPSKSWVESHIPHIVSAHAFKKSQNASHIDYETMSQAYCNIIAGGCMSLGLKFAGSANDQAFQTLMHYSRMFLSLSGTAVSEQAGKSTLETCLNVSVLSLAMVMAGTGDLEVLRLCRHLRSRIGQAHSFVHYGSHLATHMALGLLFLGGGRYTLKTTPTAIGAMICAFYPKFPTHSNDNRYHLQAFCHLYVLAVEPRLIIPRDIDTGRAVYAHLRVVFKDTPHYKGADYLLKTPALLPELHLLQEVSVCDPRYWPIVFDRNRNWNTLKELLEKNGQLFIKQKAGCLPYTQDQKGLHSVLSQHLAKVAVCGWAIKPAAVSAFSCDPLVQCFLNYFLLPRSEDQKEGESQQQLFGLLCECAVQEKMEAFPDYLNILQDCTCVGCGHYPDTMKLWQMRLVMSYQRALHKASRRIHNSLIRSNLVLAVQSMLRRTLSAVVSTERLKQYLEEKASKDDCVLASYLTLHGIPSPRVFKKRTAGGKNLSVSPLLCTSQSQTCVQLLSFV